MNRLLIIGSKVRLKGSLGVDDPGSLELQFSESVEAAMPLIRQPRPTMILLELPEDETRVPATVAKLRAHAPHTPIITVGWWENRVMETLAIRSGANLYLTQPIDARRVGQYLRYFQNNSCPC